MVKISIYLKTIFCCLLLAAALTACFRPNAAEPTRTPAPTQTATQAAPEPTIRPSATLRPTERPTATPSPTPEPIQPSITLSDQSLDDEGVLTVNQVVSPEQGWLVIQADDEGEPGIVLGFTEVSEGENEDVVITVDPMQVTDNVFALLYLDEGGTADSTTDSSTFTTLTPVATEGFAVTIEVALPALAVSDQAVSYDGVVQVDSVVSAGPGWLVLYTDDGGQPGRPLAQVPVEAGLNEQLTFVINWREATPQLHAALYADTGRPGRFDFPEADPPVLVRNNPVLSTFAITLPPDIFVLDQAVINGQVVIERAISNGPGWVVIQFDDGGQPGLIIGFAFLEDGLNEHIVVEVAEEAVTPTLFAYLHEDTGLAGEFDYPAADNPIRFEGRAPEPVAFNTQPGNYLMTQDQVVVSDTITIPLVVADTNLWVVVYADNNGELAGIIGRTWVPAGVNHNVAIQIDTNRATPTVQAVLHIDTATPEQFDYPDGDDAPLFRNRRLLAAPFTLLEE